jgi:hypothetical protein
MRILFGVVGVLAMVGTAMAGNLPTAEVVQPTANPCNLPCIFYNWDFAVSNQGFTAPHACDTGGVACWAYGNSTIPGATGPIWGTGLLGMYPNNAGDGLWSPSFSVTEECKYVELYHYFDIESNYDGANVKFNDMVVHPAGGYTGVISTSTAFYAYCVDNEMGWTGTASGWRTDCFDMSSFVGQTGQLSFEFGSDSSVTYRGWALGYVKVGGFGVTPAENSTWGNIKGLFR